MTRRLSIAVIAVALAASCSQRGASQPPASGQPPPAAAPATSPAEAPTSAPASPNAAPAATPDTAPKPAEAPAPSSAAARSTAASASAPAEPSKPQFRAVTIPTGTTLHIRLASAASSATSKVEDPVRGELSQAIVVNGTTVAPAGSEVRGTVLSAVRSGRVKGRASLAIGFDRLRVGSETHQMQTVRVAQAAKSTVKRDAKRTGIAAGAGAVIGAIAGGGKGAAVGGAIGAGAGTGVAVSTRGDEVSLREGAIVTTKLRAPLTLQIPER